MAALRLSALLPPPPLPLNLNVSVQVQSPSCWGLILIPQSYFHLFITCNMPSFFSGKKELAIPEATICRHPQDERETWPALAFLDAFFLDPEFRSQFHVAEFRLDVDQPAHTAMKWLGTINEANLDLTQLDSRCILEVALKEFAYGTLSRRSSTPKRTSIR
jgi:hypothetical protein